MFGSIGSRAAFEPTHHRRIDITSQRGSLVLRLLLHRLANTAFLPATTTKPLRDSPVTSLSLAHCFASSTLGRRFRSFELALYRLPPSDMSRFALLFLLSAIIPHTLAALYVRLIMLLVSVIPESSFYLGLVARLVYNVFSRKNMYCDLVGQWGRTYAREHRGMHRRLVSR